MKKDIVVPAAGESVTEGDIVSWNTSSGSYVEMDEILLELETDKATLPIPAEVSGVLSISIQEGTVNVGDILGTIDTEGKPDSSTESETKDDVSVRDEDKSENDVVSGYSKGHPSPAAAQLGAEKGLTVSEVTGSGKGGRITKEDVLSVETLKSIPSKEEASEPIKEKELSGSSPRGVREEKVSRMRRTIARRLVEAQHETAMLTTFNEVDMSVVMGIRKEYKDVFIDSHDVKLGFMSFFVKAVCEALKAYPSVNGYFSDEFITYHDYCDVGIAVSTPKGLIVPVIRNAQTLAFHEIELAIQDFAQRGRAGKITPNDMDGGTFTITNGGIFGSMLSTPIINRPQSAILGMHNIVQRPVVVDGEVTVRPIMYLALSYDHRIIDGSESVRFLVKVKDCLEDPHRMLLQL